LVGGVGVVVSGFVGVGPGEVGFTGDGTTSPTTIRLLTIFGADSFGATADRT
jgi:hypothetical protein